MPKDKIYEIDGKEYLATKVVELDGIEYQEFCSADILKPSVMYAVSDVMGKKFRVVRNWDTYLALRRKYAICKELLKGKVVLRASGDSEVGDLGTKIDSEISEKVFKREYVSCATMAEDITDEDIMEEFVNEYEFEKYQRFMEGEIRAIEEFRDVELKLVKDVNPHTNGMAIGYVIDSGEYKGRGLGFAYRIKQEMLDGLREKSMEMAEQLARKKVFYDFEEFMIIKGSEEVAKLFEGDVKEFSGNGAERFGEMFAKHGIDDTQGWLEEKLRGDGSGYGYMPMYINLGFGGISIPEGMKVEGGDGISAELAELMSRGVQIASIAGAKADKHTRAHEMAHRAIDFTEFEKFSEDLQPADLQPAKEYPVGRNGYLVVDVQKFVDDDGDIRYISVESGRGFGEGVTNMVAEVFAKEKYTGKEDNYRDLTFFAKQAGILADEDTVFEGAFFGPEILVDKMEEVTRDKLVFANVIKGSDEVYRLVVSEEDKGRISEATIEVQGEILDVFVKKAEDSGTGIGAVRVSDQLRDYRDRCYLLLDFGNDWWSIGGVFHGKLHEISGVAMKFGKEESERKVAEFEAKRGLI